MRRFVLAGLAATIAVSLGASGVLAGVDTGPKVALHVTAGTTKGVCTLVDPNTKGILCSNYTVDSPINTEQLIYLVVAQADTPLVEAGIQGLSCGIEYDGVPVSGVDVTTWSLCATGLQFTNPGPRGDWPASGAGNRITWLTCQSQRFGTEGIQVVAGAFNVYAYSDDTFKVTPSRLVLSGPELTISGCGSATQGLDTTGVATGWVGFGATLGCNPCNLAPTDKCDVVPVVPTTWGKIKSKYKS